MFATRVKFAALMRLTAIGLTAAISVPFNPDLSAAQSPAKQRDDRQEVGLDRLRPQQTEKRQPRTDQYGDPLPPGALTRIGTVRFWQAGNPLAVVFSPDSKTLATTSAGGIRIGDAATGKELHRFLDSHLSFFDVAFTPDGNTVVAKEDKAVIYLCDLTPGCNRQPLPGRSIRTPVGSPLFSPDGKTLAVSSNSDRKIHLLDLPTGKGIRQFPFGHTGNANSV